MTTSQTQLFLTEILEGKPIPVGKLEYFRERLRSRLHQLVLREWISREDRGLSQAELARRIGKKPEVVNRLLGAPGNWTLNTVSDLLLGMASELDFTVALLTDKIANTARPTVQIKQEPAPASLREMIALPPSSQAVPVSGIAKATSVKSLDSQ